MLIGCNEEKEFFIVSFDTKCDLIVESKTIEKGQRVEKPNITRDGYSLAWYLDDEVYDFSKKVDSDITLTAKWEEISENEYRIVVSGENKIYLGYSCRYIAKVYPDGGGS